MSRRDDIMTPVTAKIYFLFLFRDHDRWSPECGLTVGVGVCAGIRIDIEQGRGWAFCRAEYKRMCTIEIIDGRWWDRGEV